MAAFAMVKKPEGSIGEVANFIVKLMNKKLISADFIVISGT